MYATPTMPTFIAVSRYIARRLLHFLLERTQYFNTHRIDGVLLREHILMRATTDR